MKTEFEVAFTNINKDEIRKKIKNLGGVCIKENTLMKRIVLDNLIKDKAYVRVRDEGNKITCTYKEIANGKLDINSIKELETEVKDFNVMVNIFKNLGLKQNAYQESYREIWTINNEVFFMIDSWPGLNPFLEIESETEDIVKKYSKKLDFDYSKGIFGTVFHIYTKELGIPHDYLYNLEKITFDNPPVKY